MKTSRDRILRRIRYARSQRTPEVPPLAGMTPLAKDHVRLYHYADTPKGEKPQTSDQMAEGIRQGGIDINKSRKTSHGEPRVIMAYTKPPGGNKVFAEFDIHKDDPRWHEDDRPKTHQDLRQLNNTNAAVMLNGSVLPHEIKHIHEPWHNTYRHLQENAMIPSVLKGDFDHLMQNPESKEAKAISYIKAHHAGNRG